MLDQTVNEMQEDLIKMRQASAQVMASQKQIENKYNQAQTTAVWACTAVLHKQIPPRCSLQRRIAGQTQRRVWHCTKASCKLLLACLKKRMVSTCAGSAAVRTARCVLGRWVI